MEYILESRPRQLHLDVVESFTKSTDPIFKKIMYEGDNYPHRIIDYGDVVFGLSQGTYDTIDNVYYEYSLIICCRINDSTYIRYFTAIDNYCVQSRYTIYFVDDKQNIEHEIYFDEFLPFDHRFDRLRTIKINKTEYVFRCDDNKKYHVYGDKLPEDVDGYDTLVSVLSEIGNTYDYAKTYLAFHQQHKCELFYPEFRRILSNFTNDYSTMLSCIYEQCEICESVHNSFIEIYDEVENGLDGKHCCPIKNYNIIHYIRDNCHMVSMTMPSIII